MSKINIPQNASATDKLKALNHHLLDKLTALRSHFGSLAHSGARGTLEANQKNEDDKTLLAAVHESADTGKPIVMPIQTYRDPVEPLQYPTINAGTPVLPDEDTTAKTNTPPDAPPVDNDHVAPGSTPFPTMRAKFSVSTLTYNAPGSDATAFSLDMDAVGGDKVQKDGYPADGVDEDNSFARWSPSGHLSLYVANPALIGKIKEGEKYYLDFTLANPAPESSSSSSSDSSSSSSSSSDASENSHA